MSYGGNREYRKNQDTGLMEEWVSGYCSEKGYNRDRVSPDQFVRVIPDNEWAGMQAAEAEKKETARLESEARAAKDAALAAWASTLPTELDEWTRIDRDRLEITDQIGNYLTGLRQFMGQTPAQILTKLDEMFSEGMEE